MLLAAAARALAARGITPVVVHGPGEEADADRVVEASSGEAALAPPTDLRMLAAVIKGARLLVAGDSGPLHLACAAGCPVVAIYGPTDPVINAPWGVPHASVFPPGRSYTGIKRTDRTASGFEGITVEAVAAAVNDVLDRCGTT
jgi:heptosyltransferase-1